MERILKEPIAEYLTAKEFDFAGSEMAGKFRHEFPELLAQVIKDPERYKIQGSSGLGNWADNPWIAILDKLITKTAQSGYYLVFLFKKDMSGVYLSLNQGINKVKQNYQKDAQNILRMHAQDFRAKLDYHEDELLEIDLNSQTSNTKLHEAGNIIAKYYSREDLPNEETLTQDVLQYLNYYEELTFNDTDLNKLKKQRAIETKIKEIFRIVAANQVGYR